MPSLTREARVLRDAIRNEACADCPLSGLSQGEPLVETVCLTGSGPVPAKVAIYGEAPGYNEDQAGVPFVGNAGALLDFELSQAGIERSDVFVSNVTRCRPPGNRAPTSREIKACAKYTALELEAVKPEIILTLGNAPLVAFTGKSGITGKRGAAVTTKDGHRVLPTFHPAYILRDPTHLPEFQSDLRALAREIAGTSKGPVTEWHTIETMDDFSRLVLAIAERPADEPFCFDIEAATTTGRKKGGLDVWAPDWRLDTVSFTWQVGESWVLPLEHPQSPWGRSPATLEHIYLLLEQALSRKTAIGNHNVKYDREGLSARGVRTPPAKWDTWLMAHILDENRSNGLKPLARSFLGADLYEQDIDYDGTTPLPQLAEYNAKDTDYTLRLYHLFRQALAQRQGLARIYRYISMPAQNALTAIEMRGFPVNLRRLKRRHAQIAQKLEALDAELSLYVPIEKLPERNWNRSNFLLWWMFNHLGLPVVKLSAKTDSPSADEEVLLELADRHPAMEVLLEWRKWAKFRGYTTNWIERVKVANRAVLHPSYKVFGTVTGRLASNMQQIPRDPFMRSIIGAPPGWKLVDADFSQIELRIAAMVAREPTMMKAYREGDDLHMVTAEAITSKPRSQITKEERSRAKPVGFGFLYGMGFRKFVPYARAQYGVAVTEAEAEQLRTAFFNRYPGLRAWHAKQRRIVDATQEVWSPIGRIRHLPGVTSGEPDVRAEAERQAINSPVQSLASDLTLLAMSEVEKYLSSMIPDQAFIVGQIHDSILIQARDDVAAAVAVDVKRIMESLPALVTELFGYTFTVPLVADTTVSQFYGEK